MISHSHAYVNINISLQHSQFLGKYETVGMAAILILIIFSSWAPRVSSVDCNGYYGYDTNFECKWMEAVKLLVPATWIAAVGIFLLALTVRCLDYTRLAAATAQQSGRETTEVGLPLVLTLVSPNCQTIEFLFKILSTFPFVSPN